MVNVHPLIRNLAIDIDCGAEKEKQIMKSLVLELIVVTSIQ